MRPAEKLAYDFITMVIRSLPSTLSLWLSSLVSVSAIWPVPQSFANGCQVLYLTNDIPITYNGGSVTYASGYRPRNNSDFEVVQAGISRVLDDVFHRKFVPTALRPKNTAWEPDATQGLHYITSLAITQAGQVFNSTLKPLARDVVESYSLNITAEGAATLGAVSAVGVLRALETFGQLFYAHSTGKFWYTQYAPVTIQDYPKYPHRGLLMDVARNFFPVAEVYRTIDALAHAKMNRLHLHVTDSQSWPLELPSMAEVALKGAYDADSIYSVADVQNMQQYGLVRGVDVYLEIDMPGHIGSLQQSHPELITAWNQKPYDTYCAEPPCGALKLNSSEVDTFLNTLWDDLLPRIKNYSAYLHIGGDELQLIDWTLDDGVQSQDPTVLRPLLQNFTDTQHKRIRDAGMVPMMWEDMVLEHNVTMGSDVVVQSWKGTVKHLTDKGLKVIDSNYNYWYLDCGRGQWVNFDNGVAFNYGLTTLAGFADWCGPSKAWQLVYSHDPADGVAANAKMLVLGGEVAAWSETIDPANLDQILWPRTAAAAEVLWSGRQDSSGTNRSLLHAVGRLNEFRWRLLNQWGVKASPIQPLWCLQAGDAHKCELTIH